MELSILDPFGDYQTEGYLRNLFKEKNLTIVGHLETAAFEDHVHEPFAFFEGCQASIINTSPKRTKDSLVRFILGLDRTARRMPPTLL